MNRHFTYHPFPPHHESGAPSFDGAGGGDAELARLVAQLDQLGDAHVREARERGLSARVFNASAGELGVDSPVLVPVLARISSRRWAAFAAAAAVLTLAVLIPLGVLPGGDRSGGSGVEVAAFRPAVLAPAGLSERLVIGLYDGDAALQSIDLVNGDGAASVVVTRGHNADAVADELEGLLAIGGAR